MTHFLSPSRPDTVLMKRAATWSDVNRHPVDMTMKSQEEEITAVVSGVELIHCRKKNLKVTEEPKERDKSRQLTDVAPHMGCL